MNAKTFSVSITASDLEKSIRFYTEGLGFEITDKGDRDGKLQYVVMKAGVARVALGRDDFQKGRDRLKGVGMRISFHTDDDLAALVARVKKAGFEIETELAPMPWGPMAFSLKDPDGIAISVSDG